MNEVIKIGKTVSTFGIKGELKVVSDFEYLDKAYKKNNKIMINNITYVITGVRYHKQYILLKVDNLDNINLVLDKVGFNIYILKRDLHLSGDEFLMQDLLEAKVIENNECIGIVKEILKGNNNLIRVQGKKEFLIPLINEYIDYFDQEKKELHTKNAISLIL